MQNITPRQLITRLVIYYGAFLGLLVAVLAINSDFLHYLPFSGNDALDQADIEVTETSVRVPRSLLDVRSPHAGVSPADVAASIVFLAITLVTAILVMLPVTWTYTATRFESGPSKGFVRALILLPIAAVAVVLLIQNSLALAIGLAALVAAVRFRVNLPDPIDGIYIFVAICVGLAGGVGFMGVALVMTMIFTVTNAILWRIDYGRNPIDEARRDAATAKLAAKLRDQSHPPD